MCTVVPNLKKGGGACDLVCFSVCSTNKKISSNYLTYYKLQMK